MRWLKRRTDFCGTWFLNHLCDGERFPMAAIDSLFLNHLCDGELWNGFRWLCHFDFPKPSCDGEPEKIGQCWASVDFLNIWRAYRWRTVICNYFRENFLNHGMRWRTVGRFDNCSASNFSKPSMHWRTVWLGEQSKFFSKPSAMLN